MDQFMETYRAINRELRAAADELIHGERRNHSQSDPRVQAWDLLVYGSVTNTLCSDQDSDLDLTLVLADFEIEHEVLLRRIKSILRRVPRFSEINEPLQIQSGVILSFVDKQHGIEIDISINKILEVLNSRLIYSYSMLDQRFRKLAVILKTWNKCHFPDKKKRINSFSIYLLLIAFLQHRRILPNLQHLATRR
jgi:DNA polymerase sigma